MSTPVSPQPIPPSPPRPRAVLQLHPAHPLLWRRGGRLQVGLERPAVFDNPNRGIEAALIALQHGVDEDHLRQVAQAHRLPPTAVRDLLEQLGDRCQRSAQPLSMHRRWSVRPSHTLAQHHRAAEQAHNARIAVTGFGPLPAALLRVLASSGCAHLQHLPDPAAAHGTDGSPHPADRCKELPAEAFLRHPVAPGLWHRHDEGISELYDCSISSAAAEAPDITVICGYGPPHPSQWEHLLRDDRLHLSVWATATGAVVVGPLVVPGRTGCLGCVHQHARDHTDDWALLCDQLWRRARLTPLATDVALASSLAVRCVLDAVTADARHLPQLWNRRVVVHDGQTRMLAHEPHPRCLCRDRPDESDAMERPDRSALGEES